MDAAEAIHEKFVAKVRDGSLPRRTAQVQPSELGLAGETLVEMFYSQCVSRQMDRISRRLQARGEGFYTIGSSGHENNAAVAEALRVDDMAFLHYRSAAFQIQRAKKLPGQTPCWDMLLSFAASAED
ncbi:MAG: 2-oxoisovalerate dehydrogenase component, partial [Sphingomonadales bacterium]|nr:2-oxoisovalerate dehydrogenase component [Sphingomonadales bacterium]